MSALRESLVPRDPQDVSEAQVTNVLNAINALAGLAERMDNFIKEKTPDCPLQSTEVTEYWKAGILSWFTFLFDYYEPPVEADIPDRWTVISYISCIFTCFIRVDRVLISDTTGAVQLTLRLWLIRDYDYTRFKYSFARGWWDPCMELFGHKDLPEGLMKKLYDEEVTRRSMIDLILTRIEITDELEEHYECRNYLVLLTFLSNFDISTPTKEVPFNRISRVLANKVAYFANNITPLEDFPTRMDLLCLHYFKQLQFVLLGSQSMDAMIIAIRSGLLWAFVQYSYGLSLWRRSKEVLPIHHKFAVDAILVFITKTIRQYMVFSSVLLAIEEALDYISDGHMAKTGFAQEWDTFLQLFTYNKAIVVDNINFPNIIYCDNLKHDISINPETMLKCSGCGWARYCSKECQKEDWIAAHHYECNRAGRVKDAMIQCNNILRKRDQLSVCRFAIVTSRLQWTSIQERAKEEYPDLSLSQLAIFFDFTEHPHVLQLKKRDKSAAKATKYLPNATIVQCRVTLGLYEVVVTAAGDIHDIENNSWITRTPAIDSYIVFAVQIPYNPEDPDGLTHVAKYYNNRG